MTSAPLPPPIIISFDHDDDDVVIGGRTDGQQQQRRRRNNPRDHNTNNPPLHHSIQSSLDKMFTQIRDKLSQHCINNNTQLILPPPHILLPSVISGTLAFYATSFSSQYIQYKLLKLSTGTRPIIIPISVGVVTVAMGSWAGHLAGLGTAAAVAAKYNTAAFSDRRMMQWNRNNQPTLIEQCNTLLEENILPMKDAACRTVHEMIRPMMISNSNNNNNNNNNNRRIQNERKEAWIHAARICIIGLLTYKTLFRSNFMSLSPSSYTARGSFARKGIPIPRSSSSSSSSSIIPSSFNYATKSQRSTLTKIGKRFGCHTCGSRLLFHNKLLTPPKKSIIFHGDHIPPVSVAKQINSRWYNRKLGRTVPQRFYPQCTNCSNKQGGLLSRAVNAGHRNLHVVGGGSESYFHGWRIRVGHLTGGLVAAVSTVGIGNNDDSATSSWLKSSSNEDEEVAAALLLVQSSRDRIRSIQYWFEDLISDAKRKISSVWSGGK